MSHSETALSKGFKTNNNKLGKEAKKVIFPRIKFKTFYKSQSFTLTKKVSEHSPGSTEKHCTIIYPKAEMVRGKGTFRCSKVVGWRVGGNCFVCEIRVATRYSWRWLLHENHAVLQDMEQSHHFPASLSWLSCAKSRSSSGSCAISLITNAVLCGCAFWFKEVKPAWLC